MRTSEGHRRPVPHGSRRVIALSQGRVVWITTAALLIALIPGGPFGVWFGTAAAACLGLAGAWWTGSTELRELLRPTVPRVVQGIAAGGLMAVATHLIYPVLVDLWPAAAGEAEALYQRLDAPPGRVNAIPLVCLVVLAEEAVFRGLAYAQLRRRTTAFVAGLGALGLYLVPQLASGSWLLPVLALTCGGLWTYQRVRADNLVVPTLTHLVWDLLVMVFFPLVR